MSASTETQEQIFNEGEHLIPGLTHDIIELIRHRTTYVFFKTIIEQDLASKSPVAPYVSSISAVRSAIKSYTRVCR